jgi:peptide/nickel transport system permease protein
MQLFSPIERASIYVTSPKQFASIDLIIEKYGLNDPLPIQYIRWISQVLQGNLGWSKSINMPVSEAIVTLFPATLELVIFSIPMIILLGILLGVLSAVYRDTIIDHVTRSLAIIGWSLPTFWSAIILLSIFYGGFHMFPPGRLSPDIDFIVNSPEFIRYTGLNIIDGLLNGRLDVVIDAINHIILPDINLTIVIVALPMRIMRSSMLEALSKEYIVAARAKGLSNWVVIYKHALRNALIPLVTIAGTLTAGLITGVVITETVFNYHGLGYWAARAATQLDIPAVLGFALFVGVVYVVANLIVDILYAYIDPRIRY